MKSSTSRRSAYGSACIAALIALAVAGPSLAAKPVKSKPKAKPAAAAERAEPAAMQSPVPSLLSRRALESASAYRAYMDRAAHISAGFRTGAQVEDSLMTGAEVEAQQLSQGVVAYAAVIALQDPSFVAGVRTAGGDEGGRRELVRRIIENPNVATTLPGSSAAANAISAGLGADGSKVAGAGALVKQAAYDVQHSAWSKAAVPGLAARLARAKSLSATASRGSEADLARVSAAASTYATFTPNPVSTESMSAPSTATVSRGLALAALAALGAGGEENDAAIQSLMTDSTAGFCMSMSKLNLNQCLSVAKPYYEDVFCLGQHILIDIGQCVSKGAGQAPMAVSTLATGTGVASSGSAYADVARTPAESR